MGKLEFIDGLKEPKFDELNNYSLLFGMPILPEKRIRVFDDYEYELFTKCWLYAKNKSLYSRIENYSGAGDKGRDVVGRYSDGTWDNYQCKQYKGSLTPTTAYKEIGKIIYYTQIGDFSAPKNYYFVAPRGIGPTLRDYLNDEELLRKNLLENWDAYCSKNITKKVVIELTSELIEYIKEFDLSIFDYVDSDQMIEDLRGTKYFKYFFGGGFEKPRKFTGDVPIEIEKKEKLYIECLLEAYSEYHGKQIESVDKLELYKNEQKHFKRQRINFFSTESLREYAIETLPSLTPYNDLKDEYFEVLIDVVDDEYPNGYKRLKEALKEICKVDCNNNVLSQVVSNKDKKGMCHHLANDGRVKWVKENE